MKMMAKKKKPEFYPGLPQISDSFQHGKERYAIDANTKDLYFRVHKEVAGSLDSIVTKYNDELKELGQDEKLAIQGQGLDGLLDYFANFAKQAGLPLPTDDKDILYAKLKEFLVYGLKAADKENIKPEEIIRAFLKKKKASEGGLEVFNLLRSGMQAWEQNQKVSGYLGRILDNMSDDEKKSLAAAHASYIQNSDILGKHKPDFTKIYQKLDSELSGSIMRAYGDYQHHKRKGEVEEEKKE